MSQESPFENLYQEDLYLIPSRTLVLIDKPWTEISEEEKALLIKILGSVRLTLAGVQILHANGLSINEVQTWGPSRIVSFGVEISPVQKRYEYIPLDGIPIIISDSLTNLDDARKKSLWQALKQMFGV